MSRRRLHSISNEQNIAFKNLDKRAQCLITATAEGQQNFADIKGLIVAQDASIKNHVTDELEKQRARLEAEHHRERLLESLYFPELKARQESIKEAHKQTFEWIFDDNDHGRHHQWDNFVKWLREDHTTYWVNGKAGSGKSTLMNMIDQDERTLAALETWAGARQLVRPTFFFWNSGTEMQKTSIGLLRSLLYQMIEAVPGVPTSFLESSHSSGRLSSQQLPLWTEERLCSSLYDLIESELSSCAICIFIDGLDEFSGSQDTLISLVEKLAHYSNTKLCVSSRPLLKYEERLSSSSMLKLQDLTKPDIKKYVSERLSTTTLDQGQNLQVSRWLSKIISTVVDRADGVFLWVEFAVNDQVHGIYNKDSLHLLRKRLETFPQDMEGVYSRIVQRIDMVYREEVALCCQMIFLQKSLRLELLSLAMYDGLDKSLHIPLSDITNNKGALIEALSRSAVRRLQATSSGLLEVDRSNSLDQAEVRFIHRTAVDFLRENEIGRNLLKPQAAVVPKAYILLIKASLLGLLWIWMPKIGSGRELNRDAFSGFDVLTLLSEAEESTGETYIDQLELLYNIMSSTTILNYPLPQDWSLIMRRIKFVAYEPPGSHLKSGREDIHHLALFLGLAAENGICKYVLYKLGACSALQDVYTKTYLLRCAMSYRLLDGLNLSGRLPIELLGQGASPNLIIDGKSTWSYFLVILYRWLVEAGLYGSRFDGYDGELPISIAKLLLTFLERGADTQNNIPVKVIYLLSGEEVVLIPGNEGVGLLEFKVDLEITPLVILRQLLARNDCLRQVEAICHDRDAPQQSICKSIVIDPAPGQRREYKMSGEESGELTGLLEEKSLASSEEEHRAARQAIIELLNSLAKEHYTSAEDVDSSTSGEESDDSTDSSGPRLPGLQDLPKLRISDSQGSQEHE